MPSIKLKSLIFEPPAFRKLCNLAITFADRITVIAGHNGIGKSTILALAANGSGLSDAAITSYFNRTFQANVNEIIHMDYVKEFEAYKDSGTELPTPIIEYEIDGENLYKRCSITPRTERREVRVVPRNHPLKKMSNADGTINVGRDAKVPLPTLYLGMTRMLPIGECDPELVNSYQDKTIHEEDATFIQSFIHSVIPSSNAGHESNNITTQSIKGTKKTTKHPDYPHSARCISLGQDSLSAIATALASFQKLSREMPDYPGGLLVIDELDAGFHPRAQKKLVTALSKAAKKLHLQVLVTTHSVSLIEAIHPDSNPVGPGGKHVDAVVYITDTLKPRVSEGYTLQDIKLDMNLELLPEPALTKPKSLKIYLEDPEAHFVLARLLTKSLKAKVKKEAGVNLKAIPLSAGCNNLAGFQKHDPYFSTVIIMLDADASIKGSSKLKNIVKLPGATDQKGQMCSPERTIYTFIQSLSIDEDNYPIARAALEKIKVTRDYLRDYFLTDETNINDRESAKKWFNAKKEYFERFKLYELWLKEHPDQVIKFEKDLLAASIYTAKLS